METFDNLTNPLQCSSRVIEEEQASSDEDNSQETQNESDYVLLKYDVRKNKVQHYVALITKLTQSVKDYDTIYSISALKRRGFDHKNNIVLFKFPDIPNTHEISKNFIERCLPVLKIRRNTYSWTNSIMPRSVK